MLTKAYIFTRFKIFSLILPAIFLLSCDLLYDEGEWAMEQRKLHGFSQVEINCIADIYYYASNETYIEISYYQKHLSDIQTDIDNGSLTIRNEFGGEWFTDIRLPRIDVYAPTLNNVSIEVAGGFFCIDTLVTDDFYFDLNSDVFESDLLINSRNLKIKINNSSGVLNASGQSAYAIVQNKGDAKIIAPSLKLKSLQILQKSSLDVVFHVKDSLQYKIIRNGDLVVYGNPLFKSGEDLGEGNLILKNE